MTENYLYISESTNPYHNLAVEQCLLHKVKENERILYLWRNAKTVVIGKNQCSFTECRTQLLEDDGGRLARRLSGGGAVYHDLGNLNFTFVAGKAAYDLDRQYDVVISAVRSLGIDAERTGRNDLTADGRKFSGNAFSQYRSSEYHHGTLLINTDNEKLARYLLVSKQKLASKGVSSVRSRVVNLSELNPSVNAEIMMQAMVESFSAVCGTPARLPEDYIDMAELEQLTNQLSSPEWLYSSRVPCTGEIKKRFDWGEVDLVFTVRGRMLSDVRVYSDALDTGFIESVGKVLENAWFSRTGVDSALSELKDEKTDDIRRMIYEEL